ncbi:MAG: hypothetical protein WCG84_03975 [Candidatus Moraniibacteriota bacterium]
MSTTIDALIKKGFAQLPDSPGVYFFVDEKPSHLTPPPAGGLSSGRRGGNTILYIGKATSLRDRVRSYFSRDIARTRGPKIVAMLERAQVVRVRSTDSVLEALLLESYLIKKYQPIYNTDEKDDKSFLYVMVTREKFPRVLVMRGRDLNSSVSSRPPSRDPGSIALNTNSAWIPGQARDDSKMVFHENELSKKYKYIFGPFPSGGALREAMKIVRRIFPFRDKCTPFEKTVIATPLITKSGGGNLVPQEPKPCFNHQIGLCPGVCVEAVTSQEYAKTIRNIKLFFEGKKMTLVRQLNKEMKMAISEQAFERANELKKTLFALGHIRDVSLLKKEIVNWEFSRDAQSCVSTITPELFRIEAYDAAHLAGQEVVGVMTVVENGTVNKAEYRKFHIRGGTGNDLASLEQLLRRRLRHSEWQLPDLIVVDGFDLQIGVAQKVLSELGLHIPVVGVVKDSHHQPKDILGDQKMAEKYHDDILLANSEAHRFAIGFHRQTRGKKFLTNS